jgi:hypothetical protein
MSYHRILTSVTRRVLLVEQELLSRPYSLYIHFLWQSNPLSVGPFLYLFSL